MPYITHVATAVPPHQITQDQAKEFAARLFRPHLPETTRLLPVFDNAGVEVRYFSRTLEWLAAPRTFAEKNQVHLESAIDLGERLCRSLIEKSHREPAEFDALFVVNSTGVATPSLDAHLLHRLQMRPDVRRVPLWGLGCAGGVSGLAHACHYLEGRPRERILLYAVELCGLTFLSRDHSQSNLIACALFGEGAAALIVEGDDCPSSGVARIRFQGALSTHYPDSLDVMGWHVVDDGLQVVFAQRIPHIVHREAARHFGALLDRFGLSRSDIQHYLIHPGGAKVIAAYQAALELDERELECSRAVLREFGNMSSVTVLFVLERHLRQENGSRSGRAILSALGPGFSAESMLLEIE